MPPERASLEAAQSSPASRCSHVHPVHSLCCRSKSLRIVSKLREREDVGERDDRKENERLWLRIVSRLREREREDVGERDDRKENERLWGEANEWLILTG
jgi:hypothetical protein